MADKAMARRSDRARLARAQGLGPSGFDPSRESTYRCGQVVLGRLGSPLRNGSCEVVLCWDAVQRPVRECEGGGWYSYSREARAWAIRYWLQHKAPPGYSFPEGADERDSDLSANVERMAARYASKYHFSRDRDGSPEGGDACGSVHDSAGLQGIAETPVEES